MIVNSRTRIDEEYVLLRSALHSLNSVRHKEPFIADKIFLHGEFFEEVQFGHSPETI